MFSGGIEMKHWAKMGYVFRYSATTATSGTLIMLSIRKSCQEKVWGGLHFLLKCTM